MEYHGFGEEYIFFLKGKWKQYHLHYNIVAVVDQVRCNTFYIFFILPFEYRKHFIKLDLIDWPDKQLISYINGRALSNSNLGSGVFGPTTLN